MFTAALILVGAATGLVGRLEMDATHMTLLAQIAVLEPRRQARWACRRRPRRRGLFGLLSGNARLFAEGRAGRAVLTQAVAPLRARARHDGAGARSARRLAFGACRPDDRARTVRSPTGTNR